MASKKRSKKVSSKMKLGCREAAMIILWFKENMGLEDWTVELDLSDIPPAWVLGDEGHLGESWPDCETKRALIWVCPSRILAKKQDPRDTLLHELSHVMFSDIGIESGGRSCEGNDNVHFVVFRLGAVLLKAYLNDRKRGWKPHQGEEVELDATGK